MPTATEEKIVPLQENINDIQEKASELTDKIADANADLNYFQNAWNNADLLLKQQMSNVKQAISNYVKAINNQTQYPLKPKKWIVCGGGYYSGICYPTFKWIQESKEQANQAVITKGKKEGFATEIIKWKNIIATATAKKAGLQSDIADIQDQIDQIIKDDTEAIKADPDVLIAEAEAESELAQLEEEGRQRNTIIIGIIVAVVIIGSIIALRFKPA